MTLDEHTRPDVTQDAGLVPYSSPHEHLVDMLLRHDCLLKLMLVRGRTRRPDDVLGFAAIDESEVQRLLDMEPFGVFIADAQPIQALAQKLQRRIDARVEQSRQRGVRLPIVELATRFALTPREVDLLFACLVVEIDPRYQRIYGFLHDDMTRRLVSPGLALDLYGESIEARLSMRALLSARAPLRYYRLLSVLDEAAMPWMSRSLAIDERIVSFLLGECASDHRIARCTTSIGASGWLDSDATELSSFNMMTAWLCSWQRLAPANGKLLIYIHGSSSAAADQLIGSVAEQSGMALLTVDAQLLQDSEAGVESTLFLVFREALLSQSAVYLRNMDGVLERTQGAAHYRTLMRCLADMGGVVFASGEQRWNWPLPEEPIALRVCELQPEGFGEQLQAWQRLSRGELTDAQLHRLISLYPLPVATIRDVWRMAQGSTVDDNALPTIEQVSQACRAHSGPPTSALARRIEPRHQWSDLILPDAQLEQLTALCSQVQHSSIVYGAWCFERKLSLGKGLNALFCGPPGTGKTMAAEVIATELGLELLKIDLSQVASKYIGETEKNLRQLFDEAARSNAILFFDEADAVLGKRSDVKDAHDRYANTQTAYLLQKMEEYPGITILASNFRQGMDLAFTRRMRFIVDFPFPEDEDRLRIWRSVWPKEVPLAADLDLAVMARQFRLSGGSIRNVALSAAFLAAEDGQCVSMHHLMRAARRELHKMGRLVNDEEQRRYG